jgi:hypothetical protein
MGITVLSRGRTGEILVEDERQDGTLVYLICRPWDGEAGSGVLVGPGEPPSEDKELQGTYPMLAAEGTGFRLTVDTTALPSGILHFRSEEFLAAAGEAAAAGAERVRITFDNAAEWGMVAELPM